MKPFCHFACSLLLCLPLTACAYFGTQNVPPEAPAEVESIDLMEGRYVQPVREKDVREAILEATDGRVELFPLDAYAMTDPVAIQSAAIQPTGGETTILKESDKVEVMEVEPATAVPPGGASAAKAGAVLRSMDPSVEIYSLDDK